MVNSPHLFEDLKLSDSEGEVDGIREGLAIKGTGTFKFVLTDNDGKAHIICIKNSLYCLTWVKVLPPVTAALGAGGGRQ
jgi:hypothetical protein